MKDDVGVVRIEMSQLPSGKETAEAVVDVSTALAPTAAIIAAEIAVLLNFIDESSNIQKIIILQVVAAQVSKNFNFYCPPSQQNI
jgi:hypothetical protein